MLAHEPADNRRVTPNPPQPVQADRARLVNAIYTALPQTQCTRCGYPDCAAYAEAIATGAAAINQCPPGGAEGVTRLAAITGQAVIALNPDHGREGPRSVALIDEDWCIGCTLCLDACPTDAILGSNKLMHTVIEPYCTGCELCIPVCPVDCISLENVTGERTGWQAWTPQEADLARSRYDFHSMQRSPSGRPGIKTPQTPGSASAALEMPQPAVQAMEAMEASDKKRSVIEAALARARTARQAKP